jgi:hypothetical protein
LSAVTGNWLIFTSLEYILKYNSMSISQTMSNTVQVNQSDMEKFRFEILDQDNDLVVSINLLD